jgi:hypothetical protein
MLILTGVKSPQLLARSKEEGTLSSTTKRLAEYGIIGSQTTTLGSKEARARAFGKIPESTGRSWEDRLRPLERTLARKSPKEKEAKKREIEELGLRKLL